MGLCRDNGKQHGNILFRVINKPSTLNGLKCVVGRTDAMGKSYHASMGGHVTHLASRGKVSSLQNMGGWGGEKLRNIFDAGGPTEFCLLPGYMYAPCRRPNLATVRLRPSKFLMGKLML